MPELPEVETVRAGLARFVLNRRIAAVEIGHPRAIRRHLPGSADFAARLVGRRFAEVCRRGKYLWLPLAVDDLSAVDDVSADPIEAAAMVAHLGMSGQLLVQRGGAAAERHLRVRISFADSGPELRFVDQRTFGGLLLDELSATSDGGELLPSLIAHIARDPLDPLFADDLFSQRLRRRNTELKRALLDQTLVSGIGNIYADESLWRAGVSGARMTGTLTRPVVARVLAAVRGVLTEALSQGGTSFDSLYVNVNGQSGYFDRSLAVYGRVGKPCPRCGTPVRRSAFMNRSSYWCPVCQPAPRVARVVD
jgi:formamidopyrimidine-DNA glycosylase